MIKISLCLWILLLCGCGEPAAAYFKETAELETELVEKTQDAKDTKDNSKTDGKFPVRFLLCAVCRLGSLAMDF